MFVWALTAQYASNFFLRSITPAHHPEIYWFTGCYTGLNWSTFLIFFKHITRMLHFFKNMVRKKPIKETHPESTSAPDSTSAVAPSTCSA